MPKWRKNSLPPVDYATFRQQVGERAQLRRQREREKRARKLQDDGKLEPARDPKRGQ
jgi:hypothetical protein